MKKSKFSEHQIISILKEVERGQKVGEVRRQHGISPSLYYQWKSKSGGLDASELKRIKSLEAENARVKKMYADLSLARDALKESITAKL